MHRRDPREEPELVAKYEPLARKALKTYGLEDAELRFLGQRANVVFRVQSEEGRWALRICDPERDHSALMRELLWLVALARDTDLRVPEPVMTRSGDLFRSISIQGLSGFRACVLFRWVVGQFEDEPSVDQLRSVGEFSARLHRHAETFRWPDELTDEIGPMDAIDAMVSRSTLKTHYADDETRLLLDTLGPIQARLRSLGTGTSTYGVIHGDLHHANYLFDHDAVGAIDFECVRKGHYAYDVATVLNALRRRPDYEALQQAFVEGYSSIRKLPCALNVHLTALDMVRELSIVAWILAIPRLQLENWAQERLTSAIAHARRFLKEE